MDSGESESLSLVRFWIFEHAFKFRMKRLTTALLLQREPALNLKCADCAESSSTVFPCLNHMFFMNTLLCDTLDIMVSLIRNTITVELLQTVDFEKFFMCAEILEEIYTQQKFIGFSAFNKLHMAMKIVPLILLVVRQAEHQDIMNHLNTLFPHYNAARLQEFMQKFKLNEKIAKQLQLRERQARVFVLQLLIAKEKRDHYIATRLVTEIQFYMRTSDILQLVISYAVTPFMPKTTIEQMASGSSHNYMDSTDPAVQILLEFVQPDMQEDDLFQVLNVLNPHTPVKTSFKETNAEPFLLPLAKPPSPRKQTITSSREANNALLPSEMPTVAFVVNLSSTTTALNDKINQNFQSICKPLMKPESFVGEHRISSSQESSNELGTHSVAVENLCVGRNTTKNPIILKICVKSADPNVPDSSVSSTECSVLLQKRKTYSSPYRAAKRVALSPSEQVLEDGMATHDDLRISSTRDEIEILYESQRTVEPRLKPANRSLPRPQTKKTARLSLPGPQLLKNIKKTLLVPQISKGAAAKNSLPGPRKATRKVIPARASDTQSDEDFIPDSQEIFISDPATIHLPNIGAFLRPRIPCDHHYLPELRVELVFRKDFECNGQSFEIYS